jgi:hypothetical protein
VLLRKLQERFLDAESQRGLREEIERQARECRAGRGAAVADLRARLQTLEAQLGQAARRVLTEDETLLPALREQVRSMQNERDGLAAELAGLEEAGDPWAGLAEEAERAAALVGRVAELRHQADPSLLRNVLAEMVSHTDLHFEHTFRGGRKFSRFVRGAVHLRRQQARDYRVTHCSRKQLTSENGPTAISFTASDLRAGAA